MHTFIEDLHLVDSGKTWFDWKFNHFIEATFAFTAQRWVYYGHISTYEAFLNLLLLYCNSSRVLSNINVILSWFLYINGNILIMLFVFITAGSRKRGNAIYLSTPCCLLRLSRFYILRYKYKEVSVALFSMLNIVCKTLEHLNTWKCRHSLLMQ